MTMEEAGTWNGLLESILVKRKINEVSIKDELISTYREELDTQRPEEELPHGIKSFLSYPEGSSHIASLMDFIDWSKFRILTPEDFTDEKSRHISTEVSPTLSSLTCNEFRIEPSQPNSQTQFCISTQVNPFEEESPKHPPSNGSNFRAGHEPTCDICMRIDRTSSYQLSLSTATFNQSIWHTEQVHQDGWESASVSMTTVFPPREAEDAAICGYGTAEYNPTALYGPVIASVSSSCSAAMIEINGDKKMFGRNIDEGPCTSELNCKRGEGKARRRGGKGTTTSAAVKKPKSSQPFCKKESNKNYRQAHRTAHIVAERLRRKQMNEYFATLTKIIPPSYFPRMDQSTILAGAVNVVKDLEKLLKHLQEKRSEAARIPVSPRSSRLVAESGERTLATPSFETPEAKSEPYSPRATADAPWIDLESGFYGQRHANLKSAAGQVEVEISHTEVVVTVYTFRKRAGQLIVLLEAFQDLRLRVSQLSVSTDESPMLYKFLTEISFRLTAKVIAGRIHESLLTLQLPNEG